VKELVVLSGKGGTGKTSLTAVFASLMNKAVLVDCDVDAANLHLLLHPAVEESLAFVGGAKPRLDHSKCNGCGVCAEACRFDAIRVNACAEVNLKRCEGCAVCARLCQTGALSMEPQVTGQWFRSRTRYGPMLHARLFPGQDNSGKLVSTLRQAARTVAGENAAAWILVDGPPGSGCPVISSLTGADYVVLVTEPTVSGFSDLQRAAAIADHFRVRSGVVVNKADINPEMADRIEEFAAGSKRDWLGRIGYAAAFTRAQRSGELLLEIASGALRQSLEGVWNAVEQAVRRPRSPFAIGR
jgi:MinD superfamily P-loop ATPase